MQISWLAPCFPSCELCAAVMSQRDTANVSHLCLNVILMRSGGDSKRWTQNATQLYDSYSRDSARLCRDQQDDKRDCGDGCISINAHHLEAISRMYR